MTDRILNVQKVLPSHPMNTPGTLFLIKEEGDVLNAALYNEEHQFRAVAIRTVTMVGPERLYRSIEDGPVTAEYLITNYSPYIDYTVSISKGSVSRNGARLTVTAPEEPGAIYLVVNNEYSRIEIDEVTFVRPRMIYPTNGLTNLGENVTFMVTAPVSGNGPLTFESMTVQVATNEAFTEDLESFDTVETGESFQYQGLQSGTTYYLRARHVSVEHGPSVWSPSVSFSTKEGYLNLIESTKLIADDGIALDWFGRALASDSTGTRIVVGARQHDAAGNNAGAGYIYRREGAVWTKEAKLVAPNAQPEENLGYAVSLSADGSTAILTGYRYNPTASPATSAAGAVYVFKRTGTSWAFVQRLYLTDAAAGDYFGWSHDLSSNGLWLAVGARNRAVAGTGSGAVYLYKWDGSAYQPIQMVSASDASAGAYFGHAVQLSNDGTHLVVGAPYTTHAASYAGTAYLFTKNGSDQWTEVQRIISVVPASIEYFGSDVAISNDGQFVAISAYFHNSGQGEVEVYKKQVNGSWTLYQNLKPELTSKIYYGWSMSLSADGSRLLVGAYGESTVLNASGVAYMYSIDAGGYVLRQTLRPSDPAATDNFGYMVKLDDTGSHAFIGTFKHDLMGSDSGAVYVFRT